MYNIKKYWVAPLAIFMVFSFLIIAAPSVPAMAEPLYVTTTSVNLRSQPNTSSSVLFTMAEGTACVYLGQSQNGFLKVQAWNPSSSAWNQGWVATNYVNASKVASNQSGSAKVIYNSSLGDSGYRISADGYVVYASSSGSWLNLTCYSLSNADYTEFNRYHDSGGWHDRSTTSYVYGRYKVSGPSYYWFALN